MPTLLDYAGASGRIDRDKLLSINFDKCGAMPKIDGCYVRAATDGHGRISTLTYRSGSQVSQADADGLHGLYTGIADSVLLGELTAQSERGIRQRQLLGYAQLHVFDVARFNGDDVSSQPFAERYAALHRWQSWIECMEPDAARHDTWQSDGVRLHDKRSGRFTRELPRDLRRLPIVPLVRGRDGARDLWNAYVERDGGEGVVVVNLDAPLGAKGSKRKCRATDTIDATVIEIGGGAAVLSWAGRTFACSARGKIASELRAGDLVEVLHNGYGERSSLPQHARIIRKRFDLTVAG
jgi:hypothetical protein